MSIAEIVMLVCFGISWPVSIAKSLRTKIVTGKSPLFMGFIAAGYVAGIVHKYYFDWNWVAALYALNLILVLIDLSLYFHYIRRDRVRVVTD